MGHRLDAADTVDVATNLLHKLQAEGWTLEESGLEIEYGLLKPGAPKLPIRAVVTVKLVPIR